MALAAVLLAGCPQPIPDRDDRIFVAYNRSDHDLTLEFLRNGEVARREDFGPGDIVEEGTPLDGCSPRYDDVVARDNDGTLVERWGPPCDGDRWTIRNPTPAPDDDPSARWLKPPGRPTFEGRRTAPSIY